LGLFSVAFAVAIQADGKIVAAGQTAPGGLSCQFALARYNTDGSLDPSFGPDGTVMTDFGGGFAAFAQARGIAIQVDGKIVAAGVGGPSSDFALARYNTDGSLDPSFGPGGTVTTDFGGFDGANAVAIQADGKIVAAGIGGFLSTFALTRYNTDGSLDPSFGTGGQVTTQFTGLNSESAMGLAIQTNGKIVAAGFAFFPFFHSDFALARYNTDGSLDPSFGTGGTVMTDFGDGVDAEGDGVAIQADGKIVVVGGAGPCTPPCEFALARYLGDPTAVPFTAFSVTAEINVGSRAFEMTATFTLDAGSDGIAPLIEDVSFQLGTFSTTIPTGLFREDQKGRFKFEGIGNGVALEVAIVQLGDSTFKFKVEGNGADLAGTANPVPVALTIGDDTGSAMIRAELQ
jgi:uncharacterized delta-60 repeat protein